jgi:hypothetical protein
VFYGTSRPATPRSTTGCPAVQDDRDLERAMEAFANTREAEEAASQGTIRPPGLG